MNKQELVSRVSSKTWLADRTCGMIIDLFLEEISKAVSAGEMVQLRGFGTFSLKQRSARIGRNPHTGEAVPIPACKKPVFKPGFSVGNE